MTFVLTHPRIYCSVNSKKGNLTSLHKCVFLSSLLDELTMLREKGTSVAKTDDIPAFLLRHSLGSSAHITSLPRSTEAYISYIFIFHCMHVFALRGTKADA